MFKTLFLHKTHSITVHLFRSVFSSFFAFLTDFVLMILLVELISLYYLIAASVSFFVGSSISYFLSVLWIFPVRSIKSRRKEYLYFLMIGAAGLLLNALIIFSLVEFLHIHYAIAKILSASCVFFANFFARKLLLFTEKKQR